MQPFVGEIIMVGFNFAPKGYALCNGQLLPLAQNTALFSVLGTTYGGDGKTNFRLPDLQCRVPIHAGDGAGLTPRTLGESKGAESFILSANQLPAHTHTLNAIDAVGDKRDPGGNSLAIEAADQTAIYGSGTPTLPMNSASIGVTGGGGAAQAVNNLPPYLVINFAIALQGVFPQRP